MESNIYHIKLTLPLQTSTPNLTPQIKLLSLPEPEPELTEPRTSAGPRSEAL